jgi:KDO2-lipid IV(A) lauroyltransferase
VNPLRAALEAAAIGAAAAIAGRVGATGARRLGRAIGDLWYHLDVRHRRIARRNLRLALPELEPERRARIARASFRHFGGVVVELLRAPSYGPQDCERLARVTGWEHLEGAIATGRGALVFSAHYGNWELVALVQAFRGRPMDLVARPLDNPYLERRLARCRQRSGNRVLPKRASAREILQSLRENRAVAIVIDQNCREPNRVFVDFFGRPAATTPALGLLAVRTEAVVVPVFSWPEPDGRLRVDYRPPVTIEASGDRAEDALRYTRECTRRIEEQVRSRPEYWLWAHRRWRTRPGGEAAVGGDGAAAPARGTG